MPEIASISALFSALSAAKDIASGMISLRDQALIQEKVIQLQAAIMEAQRSGMEAQLVTFTMQDTIREQKAKIDEMESWQTETSRYNLVDFGGNTFAYELKADAAYGEPIHRLCPACFQHKTKSILQFRHRGSGQDIYKCVTCGVDFPFGVYVRPPQNSYKSDW